jgi:hypothetical protein
MMRLEREAKDSPSSGSKVKDLWNIFSAPLTMAWCIDIKTKLSSHSISCKVAHVTVV